MALRSLFSRQHLGEQKAHWCHPAPRSAWLPRIGAQTRSVPGDLRRAVVLYECTSCRRTEVETGARNIDHIIRETLLPMMSSSLLEKMSEGPLPDRVRVEVGPDERFTLTFGEPKVTARSRS